MNKETPIVEVDLSRQESEVRAATKEIELPQQPKFDPQRVQENVRTKLAMGGGFTLCLQFLQHFMSLYQHPNCGQ